uniref:Uncharacterized protein n=1 Tax=Anser cygnoides TaxID=8845 RepID=A0A8B9ILB0_ANSCY
MAGTEPWGGRGMAAPDPHPRCPHAQICAAMKLLVATLLLLCACSLQAALTKREAEPEPGAEPAPDATIPLSRHFQTFSDFVTKELPQKLQAEELRSQAKYWGAPIKPLSRPPCPVCCV